MKKLYIVLISCAVVIACTNDARNTTRPEDTTIAQKEIHQPEETGLFQKAFPALINHLSKQDSSFTVNKFSIGELAKLDTTEAYPINSGLASFYPYFIYNSDSTLAIDLYSYNYIQSEHNGKTVMEAGGPDTEVAVVNFKDKIRRRILFSGPSVAILDAKWVNNNEIIVAGAEEIDVESIKPLMWRINISNNSHQLFTYPTPVKATIDKYNEGKLPF